MDDVKPEPALLNLIHLLTRQYEMMNSDDQEVVATTARSCRAQRWSGSIWKTAVTSRSGGCRTTQRGVTMTPDDVISIFERLNREGRSASDLDHACAAFAKWLAGAWEGLGESDIALLTSIGATFWREGYARRY